MESVKKYFSKIQNPFSTSKVDVSSIWFVFVYIFFSLTILSVILHLLLFFSVSGVKEKSLNQNQDGIVDPIDEKAIKETISKFEDRASIYRFIEQETASIKDPSI